jgi:peptidoglycan/xylan/chitin deacetylase (PgdA/CDA1 family)
MTKAIPEFTDYSVEQALSIRAVARHAAVSTLGILGNLSGGTQTALARNRVQFLLFHAVFEDEAEGLRNILAALSQSHRFISYSEAVRRVELGTIDAPVLALSFDDGMRNNLRAARIAEEFGISACFFVCSSMVSEKDPRRKAEFCHDRLHGPAVDFLDWDDLEALRRAGHEIGSHTVGHRKLSQLSGMEVADELELSRRQLSSRLGNVSHFAWPYGRFADVPENFGAMAAAAGYESCASGVRGAHVTKSEAGPLNLCLRRENLQPRWPVSHVRYLLAASSRRSSASSNHWRFSNKAGDRE